MEDVVLIASSSSTEGGIGCWDLRTGKEKLRYKSCASTPHGLVCVGGRFIASSQIRPPSAPSGNVLYWSWSKAQPAVKSFPAEPVGPIAVNYDGTYMAGGGQSGEIYLWEVNTGILLTRWYGHLGSVTRLVFSEDGSLLISGAKDGGVRVWSLIRLLDEELREEKPQLYEHSFSAHSLRVTDIAIGYGGYNAIFVSASEDRTCKVWSLLRGGLVRNIVFPSVINAVVLDPGEHVFYAGGKDGKIYIAALHADHESYSKSDYGMYILKALYGISPRKKEDTNKSNVPIPITCLTYGVVGNLLVSGSEDGKIRVWDCSTHNIVRTFEHSKGPLNNVIVTRQPQVTANSHPSSRKGFALPPPLNRNANPDEEINRTTVLDLGASCNELTDISYCSSHILRKHINDIEQQGTAAATDMEVEKLKVDCQQTAQLLQHWKKTYEKLHQFCVNELLDGDHAGEPSRIPT